VWQRAASDQWGSRGRWFDSSHSDQKIQIIIDGLDFYFAAACSRTGGLAQIGEADFLISPLHSVS